MRIIYWLGVFGTVIGATALYWPPFVYIFLFVLYSVILIALGKFLLKKDRPFVGVGGGVSGGRAILIGIDIYN